MQGLSVIICCYNSAARLSQTLAHLAKQVTDVNWEVIVVDNNSTDQTKEVAEQEWKKSSLKTELRVVAEKTPGLSAARQKGVQESKFDTIIFCDDDNWLASDYVDTAFKLIHADPTIGAIGAHGTPVFETTEPKWFKNFQSFFAVGEQHDSIAHDINNFQYVYGAGVVINKAALEQLNGLGFVNITTDRIGNKLVSGGDIELCLALQLIGYKVVYNPSLRFQHFMTAPRLTLRYALRLASGIGYSADLLFPYRKLYSNKLSFPFPSSESTASLKKELFKSRIALLLPFSRYGGFFEKLKIVSYLNGKLQFHREKQGYFQNLNKFLSSR